MKYAGCIFTVLLFVGTITVSAQDDKEGLQIGVMFGPAIPSETISDVYDLANDQSVSNAYDVASNLGYDIAAKLRFGLSGNLSFSGGVMFASFPNQGMVLRDSLGRVYNLQTTTLIVPITAGVTWLPVRSVLTPFIGAHLAYTYRSTVVSDGNIIQDVLNPGQEIEPQVSRLGAAINAGLEFNFGITPFIDFTYVVSNMIGRDDGEAVRSFLTVNVGLMF